MYKRRERIGQGWLGTLYSGEDASGRLVRLIPLQKCTSSWVDEVRERHKLMSSRLIYRALPSLGIHSISGEPYWVGGWRNGVNLSIAMKQYSIPYPVLTAITQQAVSILLQARTVGVVHGDLHPQAMWLTANGEVWLDGFGQILGKSEVETRTSAPHYTSSSGKATSAGDVYSLGVILLEAFLDGEVFESGLDEAEHEEILRDIPQRLREKKLPKGLIQLLMKMLSFSDETRITQEKISRKLDNKTPEMVVHSWLRAKYPNIYTSGAPEQKIAHDSGQVDKRIVDRIDEIDDFDNFGKDIGSLDFLFQSVDILPTYNEVSVNEQSDDIIDFEQTQNVREKTDRLDNDLEDLTFDFEDKTVVEPVSEDDHTEMIGESDERLSDEEYEIIDDPLAEDDNKEESSSDDHTQAVQVFEKEEDSLEDFFSSEVTQQLFSDHTEEIIWKDSPEEKREPAQYVVFGLIVIGLIFMGLYSDQIFDSAADVDILQEANTDLSQPKDVDLNVVNPNPEKTEKIDTENTENTENTGNDNIEEPDNREKIIIDIKQSVEKETQNSVPSSIPNATMQNLSRTSSVNRDSSPRNSIEEDNINTQYPSKNNVEVNEKSVRKEMPSITSIIENSEEVIWGTSDDDKSIWKQKKENQGDKEPPQKTIKEEPKIEMGMVQLVGEVENIVLIRKGKDYSVGELEAGVYQVRVTFAGLPAITVGNLKLEGGKKATITCDAFFASCQIDSEAG